MAGTTKGIRPELSTLKLSGGGVFTQGDIRVELDGLDISGCVERIELILDAKQMNRATIYYFGNVQFEAETEQ